MWPKNVCLEKLFKLVPNKEYGTLDEWDRMG
jgi:hypothetical protein